MKNTTRWRLIITCLIVAGFWWLSPTKVTPPTLVENFAPATLNQTAPVEQSVSVGLAAPQKILKPAPRGLTASKLNSISLTEKEVASLRSDMKANMSMIYTAQASFFSDYKRYTTDIHYTGYTLRRPSPFKMGFLTPFHAHEVEPNERVDELLNSDALVTLSQPDEVETQPYTQTAKNIDLEDLSQYCSNGCTANEEGFESVFAANLDDDDTLDVWVINEKKQIIHKVDDLKE